MYVDASNRKTGDTAYLISESLSYPTHSCLQFYYHMSKNSSIQGTLRIWIQQVGNKNFKPVWEISGYQGNRWNYARVSVSPQNSMFKVSDL